MHVGDAVVGLAFVITNDRSASIHRLLGIHDRIKCFVVNVDQLDGILGDVAIRRDDVGDLLALEAHLVCGEHRLGVIGQGGHPREVVSQQRRTRNAFQSLAGDHCDNTWQRFSC